MTQPLMRGDEVQSLARANHNENRKRKLDITASKIKIKPYSSLYSSEICDLFHSSIHAIDTDIYSKAQQEAWCSTPPDYLKWSERLDNTQPWMDGYLWFNPCRVC